MWGHTVVGTVRAASLSEMEWLLSDIHHCENDNDRFLVKHKTLKCVCVCACTCVSVCVCLCVCAR